jgi:hypothetical protein
MFSLNNIIKKQFFYFLLQEEHYIRITSEIHITYVNAKWLTERWDNLIKNTIKNKVCMG